MSSTSETGHAKNVANFASLIAFIAGYGTAYNPSKAALKPAAMKSQLATVSDALQKVNTAFAAHKNAVNTRAVAFRIMGRLTTRVFNALRATGTSVQVVENALFLVRKLRGNRAGAKLSDQEKADLASEGKEIKEISSSQTSFDSRLENFDKLIKLLSTIPQYTPNETDLKVTALIEFHNDLNTKNIGVINPSTTLSNARIARDKLLYQPGSGLLDTVMSAKNYIKSVYGVNSPQFKQVAGIEFKYIRI